MGGKGQRRREKNYEAAHGGRTRLPPPPTAKQIEALPSKLRILMDLRNPSSSTNTGLTQRFKNANQDQIKKGSKINLLSFKDKNLKVAKGKHLDKKDASPDENRKRKRKGKEVKDLRFQDSDSDENRKRKRKWKEVKDLRFQDSDSDDDEALLLSRKARKKQYLEARKKKHKKAKIDDTLNFPGREKIKFGEIVEAPPTLSFPKARNTLLDASHERVRLQAIGAYRDRRGWASRLGIQHPLLLETPLS